MFDKTKSTKIITVVVYLLYLGYVLIPGVWNLVRSDYSNENISYIAQSFEISHSMNFIPTGKEYYYLGVTEDQKSIVVIKASKEWMDDNFDARGNSLSYQGVSIKGRQKKLSYDVTRTVSQIAQDYDEFDFPMGDHYIDLTYYKNAILSIIAGVILILLGITGYLMIKKGKDCTKEIYPVIWIVVLFGILCFSLYLFSVR